MKTGNLKGKLFGSEGQYKEPGNEITLKNDAAEFKIDSDWQLQIKFPCTPADQPVPVHVQYISALVVLSSHVGFVEMVMRQFGKPKH